MLIWPLPIWVIFINMPRELAITGAAYIGCDATDTDIPGCGHEHLCRVTCSNSCKDAASKIWGTAQYTYGSAVCTAAAHDGRLDPSDRNTWTVDLVRHDGGVDVFKGSIRYGLPSMGYRLGALGLGSTWYEFVSPRIKEPVADITSLHLNYRYPSGDHHHQQFCFVSGLQDTGISFEPFVNPRHVVYKPAQPHPGVYSATWSTGGPSGFPPGGFTCSVEGSLLSRVTSVAMVNHDHVQPERLSLTVDAGETATLSDPGGHPVRWTKDGGIEVPSGRDGRVSVEKAQLGDAGVYVMDFGHGVWQVSRLVVRSCPRDLYGDGCQSSCPPCRNGGVCHDVTGVCLCPPGFFGEHCQDHCHEGGFGQNCSHNCSTVPGSSDCSHLLFCLPDPYGCSCYPGFGGVDCDRPCPKGTYGADCKQHRTCFCGNGQPCHPKWGFCPRQTCAPGFRDPPNCDRSYPVLKNISVHASMDDNGGSLEVVWRKWDPLGDIGAGRPQSYRVQYRVSSWNATWQDATVVEDVAMPRSGLQSRRLMDLLPNTPYDVRVLVRDEDGNFSDRFAYVKTVTTPCGRPQRPPYNITADTSTVGIVDVTWKIPDRSTWQCSRVGFEIAVDGSTPRNVGLVERYSFVSSPFTPYRIRLRTVADDSKAGDWSPELRVTSAEEAPSPVRNITVYRIAPKTYRVSWSLPERANGIIRSIIVRLQMDGSWCTALPLPPPRVVPVPATRTTYDLAVTPAARYVVSLAAVTILQGEWTARRFETQEEVPEGIPQNVVVSEVTRTSARVSWSDPNCRFTNGRILAYNYTLRTNASWQDGEVSGSTRDRSVSFRRLTPFTSYELDISALNGAGGGPNESVGFTTRPDVPRAPSDLTVYSAACDYVSVTWLPPYPPTGELESYHIFYKPKSRPTYREFYGVTPRDSECGFASLSGRRCFTIRRLAPNVEYEVHVTAKNKFVDVWSGRSNVVRVLTAESTPGSPAQLTQRMREDTAFAVSWKEPAITNGVVLGYRVNITQAIDDVESQSLASSETVGAAVLVYTVTELSPGSKYNVTVEAFTAVGFGKAASIVAYTRAPLITLKKRQALKSVGKNSVTVTLVSVPNADNIKYYYVIVERLKPRPKRSVESSLAREWIDGKVDYNTSLAEGQDFYVAARLSPREANGDFVVGDGHRYGPYDNPPLTPGNRYRIGMAAEVDFNGDSRMSYVPLVESVEVGGDDVTAASSAVTAVVVTLLLLLLLGVVAVVWKGQRYFVPKLRLLRGRGGKNAEESSTAECLDETDYPDIEMEEVTSVEVPDGTVVPVPELWDHVQRVTICSGLRREYLSIPKGRLHPTEEGSKSENRVKNRYRNQLPYDHSRVKLRELDGVPCSDYINASYVDGYEKPKKFIATQGPKPQTVVDFWRMVWQENVCKIVMLTNVVERGGVPPAKSTARVGFYKFFVFPQTKCEKYWPDKQATYGRVVVRLMSTESFPDHDVNQFHVTEGDTTKEVKHFHMKTWPDHEQPLHPATLLAFHKKVCSYRAYNEAPVVVHCSAGVGRTGTYILFDIVREQAAVEGVVNVPQRLRLLRQDRMNMVETLEQYSFVYHAIAESTSVRDHSVPTPRFREHYSRMLEVDAETGDTNLAAEFEELNRLKPRFSSSNFEKARGKNSEEEDDGQGDAIPADGKSPSFEDGTFVDGVYVNGTYRKDVFLVTQTPSREQVEEFWKAVVKCRTRTLVTLDVFVPQSEVVPFWPTEGTVQYGDLKIERADVRTDGVLCVQTFKVSKRTKGRHFGSATTLKLFHLSKWSEPDVLVSLIDSVERWQRQNDNGIVVVQCRDGYSASGVFCCCMLVLEKMKSEQEADVFGATRVVRANRPQFIKNADQYEFCYSVAAAYLQSFDTYANL